MTARQKILASILLLAVLGGVAWESLRSRIPDPIYEGKHLSYWLGCDDSQRDKIDAAVRQAGTNAIPLLMGELQAHQSALTRLLVDLAENQRLIKVSFTSDEERWTIAREEFVVMEPEARRAIPVKELMRIYDMNLSGDSQKAVIFVLNHIEPASDETIPFLVRATTNSNSEVRFFALAGLGKFHVHSEVSVPVLLKFLDDSNSLIQKVVVDGLGRLGHQSEVAVPRLLELRGTVPSAADVPNDKYLGRDMIDDALVKIDSAAAANAGIQTNKASPAQ
jgi:HEAT repeat protein